MYCQQCQRLLATPDRICDSCRRELDEGKQSLPESATKDIWFNLELITLGLVTHVRVPVLVLVGFFVTMSVTLSAVLIAMVIRSGLLG